MTGYHILGNGNGAGACANRAICFTPRAGTLKTTGDLCGFYGTDVGLAQAHVSLRIILDWLFPAPVV